MAQIELHGVARGVVAVAQRQRILRTLGVDGPVFQAVFAALERGGDQVRALAPFVLEQVAAQAGVAQVGRGACFVFVARVGDGKARSVGTAPLGRPIETQRVHGVQAAVVLAQAAVVAAVGVVDHQRAFEAMHSVHLQADARVARRAAVAVTVRVLPGDRARVEALAVVTCQPQGIVQRAAGTANPGFHLGGVVAAHADAYVRRRTVLTALGEDLHHAPQGVRAIHGARRATQHFDAVDEAQRDALPGRATGGLRVDAHPIDVHRSKARFRATQKNASGGARATVARELHTGQTGQQVGQTGGATAFDGFTVHNGDIGHQVGQRLRGARGCHHGFRQRRCAQVLRQQLARC